MISMDKKYVTRDGREVRIYAVDGALWSQAVHGAYYGKNAGWTSHSWYQDGGATCAPGDALDLIEVKPKITRTYWLVHARDGGASRYALSELHAREAIAVTGAPHAFLAITGPHEITFTPGDGLCRGSNTTVKQYPATSRRHSYL